jgi:ABC-type transporter Mla subunit MlaD
VRRLLAIGSVLLAAATLAVVGTGAGDGRGDPYLVRAIFDNAGFVIAGEDVKIAGVKVGSIESLDVTRDDKAVVVLRIDDPGYQDFRADAQCIVRPQSLIGEKFVECTPTRRRAVGAAAAPPLEKIDSGPGEGQYLLPVTRTMKAVDLDLLNNTMRLPYRQRFSIILNELGTGLAGRGADLRAVVRRADPALREVDDVLEVLGRQNKTLAQLATDSDTALAPLARDRAHVASFIEQAGGVAEATAERRTELEQDIERLPRFLRELSPTMDRLGEFADQASPVFADLGAQAPQISKAVEQLGPFSKSATISLETLGEATKTGTPAVQAALPITRDLRAFAKQAVPVSSQLSAFLRSFQRNEGIERAMDFIFYGVSAINGFDQFGHYLRAALLVNTCSSYAVAPVSGCSANFRTPQAPAQTALTAGMPRDDTLRRTAAALRGEKVGPAPAEETAAARAAPTLAPSAGPTPTATPTPAPAGGSPAPNAAETGLLDYLFGQEGG